MADCFCTYHKADTCAVLPNKAAFVRLISAIIKSTLSKYTQTASNGSRVYVQPNPAAKRAVRSRLITGTVCIRRASRQGVCLFRRRMDGSKIDVVRLAVGARVRLCHRLRHGDEPTDGGGGILLGGVTSTVGEERVANDVAA